MPPDDVISIVKDLVTCGGAGFCHRGPVVHPAGRPVAGRRTTWWSTPSPEPVSAGTSVDAGATPHVRSSEGVIIAA